MRNVTVWANWALVTLLAFSATQLVADTTPASEEPATTPATATQAEPELAATPAEIQQWLNDLQSQDFETRTTASKQLTKVGKAAITPLQKAANGDDLEAAARAIAVLKELSGSKTDGTRDAAKAALEALTKSENRSVAARANAALNPPEDANVSQPGARVIGNIRLGGIQINRVIGNEVRGIRIQNRQVNGKREIEVDEDGKKTEISESPEDGITIQVTETVDGKKKTTTTKAKNVEDLKKNSPEAHKIYEKYAGNGNRANVIIGNGGAAQIQIQAVPGPFQRRVLPPRRAARIEAAANRLQTEAVEHARKKIENSIAEIRKLAADGKLDEEAVNSLTAEIQAAIKEISASAEPAGGNAVPDADLGEPSSAPAFPSKESKKDEEADKE